ncbi:hypothetical protein CEXT_16501 [Caerostris extrusa]|uniref:Uncharacterized protein n=1 Tax=Caerostris extrusa TaxID=172846 RepID=A0AAV4RQ75_CAEEX|nr:hypothetical protein CEXT_16501 [Caerostris extrusa]
MASRCKIIVVKLINFQKASSYTIIVEPLVRRRPPPHRHYCLDLRLLFGLMDIITQRLNAFSSPSQQSLSPCCFLKRGLRRQWDDRVNRKVMIGMDYLFV